MNCVRGFPSALVKYQEPDPPYVTELCVVITRQISRMRMLSMNRSLEPFLSGDVLASVNKK